jgi:hypothetical protein
MRTLLSLAAITLGIGLATPALAQPAAPPPVTLRASGVFGDEAVLGQGYDTLVVDVHNVTTATLRGRVEVVVRQWQVAERVTEVPLDVPAGETRRAMPTVFLGDSASVEVRFVADGRPLATTSLNPQFGTVAPALVLLSDPPRLRASLLDLQTDVTPPSYGYGRAGPQTVNVPIGIVTFDPRTSDPVLPTSSIGWANVGVLVASAPSLSRLDEQQAAALRGWLHAGGRMLVFPRTDADLSSPWLTPTFGTLGRSSEEEIIDGQPPIHRLDCGTHVRERFGCSERTGFGVLYVADFDGASPPWSESAVPTTRAVVSAIVNASNQGYDYVAGALPLGRVADDTTDTTTYYGSQRPSLSRLRQALDPNEGYRPALALVGIVLFLYVLVVGPINFWWVGRRKTPTLALVTTPALSLACVAVIFLVGYVGKGVVMRYRRIELVDVVDGDTLATSRRYTGYYFTRPSGTEIAGPEHGGILHVLGGAPGPVLDGERPSLRDAHGGLWETVFTREDHTEDLGGAIAFARDGSRLAQVQNGSTRAIEGACVLDMAGQLFMVGAIPAGGTAEIPRDPAYSIGPSPSFYDETAPEVAAMRECLGLSYGDERYVLGLMRQLGTGVIARLPVLWARTAPDPASSPTFSAEEDLRIVRVVPNWPASPIFLTAGSIADLEDAPPPTPAPDDPVGAALQNFFGHGSTPAPTAGGAP